MKNGSMIYRNERQKTFDQPVKAEGKTFNWNDIIEFTPSYDLIEAGFYFTPTKRKKNRITCTYCNKSIIIQKDFKYDQIVNEHLKRNSNCPMSIVLNLLDLCKDLSEDKLKSFWENSKYKNPLNDESIGFRKEFYLDFPLDKGDFKPNSDSLAKAGFIYQPRHIGDDRVSCMFCKCALDYWEKNDDPIEEHIKNANKYCYFLDKFEEDKRNRIGKEDASFDLSMSDIVSNKKNVNLGNSKVSKEISQSHKKRTTPELAQDKPKSKKRKKDSKYGKKDENLEYWNKLPDDDLLQEFIEVSKRNENEAPSRPVLGTDKSKTLHAEIQPLSETQPKPTDLKEDQVKSTRLSYSNDFEAGFNSQESAADDIEFEKPSSSEYEPTQETYSDDFNSPQKLSPKRKTVPPKQSKTKNHHEFIKPEKPSLLSSSPIKSKMFIKRTTPVPIFDDSSTDNDYGENHVAKLEKKIIKTNTPMIQVDEDSKDQSSELNISPIRISPLKITTTINKPTNVKPSLFDSSIDFSLEKIAPVKTEKNSKVESIDEKTLEQEKGSVIEVEKDNQEDEIVDDVENDNKSPKDYVNTNLFVQSSNNELDPALDTSPIAFKNVEKHNSTVSKETATEIKQTERSAHSDSFNDLSISVNSSPFREPSQHSMMEQDFLDNDLTTSTPNKLKAVIKEDLKDNDDDIKHEAKSITPDIISNNSQAEEQSKSNQSDSSDDTAPQKTGDNSTNDEPMLVAPNENELQLSDVLSHTKPKSNEQMIEEEKESNNSTKLANITSGASTKTVPKKDENTTKSLNKPKDLSYTTERNPIEASNFIENKSTEKNDIAKVKTLKKNPIAAKTPLNPKEVERTLSDSDKENQILGKKLSQSDLSKDRNKSSQSKLSPTSTKSVKLSSTTIAKPSIVEVADVKKHDEEEVMTDSGSTWQPKSMNYLIQQINDLKNSSKELQKLSSLPYDLDDDLNGDLTGFIAEMPEEEEQMTIRQWIEHCAINCRDIVDQSLKVMNQHVLDEYDRAIDIVSKME
ncbi:uncharacterized protein KGF55_003395 [Candida pseudojiufengensis]|uniref:uncharacterized protein n=1 Tax=Candida pseudojiufengensis TaxID=497109 RepID=UPI00222570C7|nr:uncharacterized protein KGF55_003395 [Candida pseudojiufengensis]KAI5962319.1 hypothetical protein KGF55_003395 [Candida pseudojiufengensis]